jgi:hypothetical protein
MFCFERLAMPEDSIPKLFSAEHVRQATQFGYIRIVLAPSDKITFGSQRFSPQSGNTLPNQWCPLSLCELS